MFIIFSLISADLASITAARNLQTQEKLPKTVYGKSWSKRVKILRKKQQQTEDQGKF